MSLSFLKKKSFYIPFLIALILVSFFGYQNYKKSHQPVQYETVAVERGDLKQTVEATGNVESENDLSLRFEVSGLVDRINVKEGDKVKAGDALANLRLAELNAAVAQAQANLNLKLAGATTEDISYYRAAVDSAKAALDQAKVDGNNSIASAQSALDTAKNNLKLAEGGENSQIVSNVYGDAVALAQASIAVLDNALTQADNILGIDNTFANQDFKSSLSILDLNKLYLAQDRYSIAKESKNTAKDAALLLTTASLHSGIDNSLNLLEDALSKMNQLLDTVGGVLSATIPAGSLTQTALDAKKTTISTTRTAVTTQLTSVITQKQDISSAKNSYSTYKIAYDKAQRDLDAATANALTSVAIKQAAYDQATANLQTKMNPPRDVDVASYRAALSQAVANRDKAIMKAPIDGVVTKVNKQKGELVTSADAAIEILSPHFEIKVDVPETDVAKLMVGNTTTITLDAFGDDTKFYGQVINIEPASTEIQDVVYYKITVRLGETDKPIKSGMTANVTVDTAARANVLYLPLRAVRTDGGKYVKILRNGQIKDVYVKLGMRADDGKVEILEGLSEGDIAVLGTVSN